MKVVFAFFISLLFGAIFHVPPKTLLAGGFTGAMGWLSFSFISLFQPPILATLIATIVIGILGEILARIYKTPVTIFIIVGFIPLVPGLKAYNTIMALTKGQLGAGIELGLETLFTAGAIALGISIVSAVARVLKEQLN